MVFNLYELNVMKPTKNVFFYVCLYVKLQVYEYKNSCTYTFAIWFTI